MKTMLPLGRDRDAVRNLCLLFVALLIAGLTPALYRSDESQPGELTVQVGKTVEISASNINFCWFPTVHRFPTGEILATMRLSGDDANPEGELSGYCVSKDGGQTWSRRYTMGAGANVDAAYTQVIPADGLLCVLGAGYDSLEADPPGQAVDFRAALTKISRGGLELTQIRDARIHLAEAAWSMPPTVMETGRKDATNLSVVYEANPQGTIIGGPGGELLATFYYMTQRDSRRRRLVLIRSTDQGRNWEEYGVIAAIEPKEEPWSWMGKEGPNEASLVRLPSGRLYCVFRTGEGGYLGEAWSADDGRTWTQPVSTGLIGVAPHLRLMQDGLLAFSTGRPGPVVVMFSSDEGKTWTNVTTVFTGQSTHYSDLIEVEPGKLLIVYDNTAYGWHPIPLSDKSSKNAIYGTFVEVRRR
jgi:hypothetical protein